MQTAATSTHNFEPNITPFLDVLLVLLVAFLMMIGKPGTMDVVMPEPCVGACTGGTQIVLEVLPGPSYKINQRLIAPAELHSEIAAVYRGRPDKTLQIAAYKGVTYQMVMSAMDVAKSSGVRVIGAVPKDVVAPGAK